MGAAVLNLFGGILVQKRRAELALLESGLNYVIVRPGGMERPTDAYKRTHKVTLGEQDTRFGGQVPELSAPAPMHLGFCCRWVGSSTKGPGMEACSG